MPLFGFDSLDALRSSIAGKLGREMPGQELEQDFKPVVGRMLLEEVQQNERHIAGLRLALSVAYLALAAADVVLGTVARDIGLQILAAAFAWTAMAFALYRALRRGWYHIWIRRIAPVADSLAIAAGAMLSAQSPRADWPSAIEWNAALLCGVLSFSGALRLTKSSARFGAALSVTTFLIVATVVDLSLRQATGIVAALITASALAGRVVGIVRRVITNEVGRLAMERQVQLADARAAEAQAASAAREQVLRVVSHDLRNPLHTILMRTDLLMEPALKTEHRIKMAEVIKRAGERMNRLIQDLLNIARMEAGQLALDKRMISPAALVADAVEMMRPLAAEAKLELRTEMKSDLPDVSADPERILQVFSNLVGNAIKFTPAGGQITLSAVVADARVWFNVTDTGPGIPPEQLEKIFGQFWQARRKDDRGIGLGLTIAKGIVEAHGGKIGVDSQVGVGTRFFFAVG